jgi:hypothetical protein
LQHIKKQALEAVLEKGGRVLIAGRIDENAALFPGEHACQQHGPVLGQVIARDDHQFGLGSHHAEKQVLAQGPFGDGFIHPGKQQFVVIAVIRQIDWIVAAFGGGFGDLGNRQRNARRSRQGTQR